MYGAASGRDSQENVGQIFEAELGGFIETGEFCFNFRAAAFVLHSGFTASLLHQFRALKIDPGSAGAAVIDGFRSARNSFGGASRRWRLGEHGSSQHSENSSGKKKSRCHFHVSSPIAMKGATFRRPRTATNYTEE